MSDRRTESIRGKAFVFGDNIDTDIIIPARYLDTTKHAELAVHCMEPVRPGFFKEAARGGIVVAGDNFGCGSSREHAPLSLLGAGILCVVAESLARIFYRNAVNTGLPVVICPGAAFMTAEGDELEVDLETGRLKNISKNDDLSFEPLPSFMRDILASGGLIPYLIRKKLKLS